MEDNIFLDFYCGFPESLDTDVFTRVFTAYTDARNVHSNLPTCY